MSGTFLDMFQEATPVFRARMCMTIADGHDLATTRAGFGYDVPDWDLLEPLQDHLPVRIALRIGILGVDFLWVVHETCLHLLERVCFLAQVAE